MAIAEIAETLRLPGYADMLLARHRAHAETFRDIVAAMPLVAGQRVLEVACGDGAVRLLRLQREGRGPQEAEVFLRGFSLPAGTKLS